MRLAISGSCNDSRCRRFRLEIASRLRPCKSAETPGGFARLRTGSPLSRNNTPWYVLGKNPLVQFDTPPLPPRPAVSTTYPGKFSDSLPSPYVNHEPMLGRPNRGTPLIIMSCAG